MVLGFSREAETIYRASCVEEELHCRACLIGIVKLRDRSRALLFASQRTRKAGDIFQSISDGL